MVEHTSTDRAPFPVMTYQGTDVRLLLISGSLVNKRQVKGSTLISRLSIAEWCTSTKALA